MKLVAKSRARILDFDIEARPLSWYAGDMTSREVTAIGCKFIGERTNHCWLLGEDTLEEMLEGFRELYDQADIVTGHYIRGYDLPNLNGAYIELGLPTLGPKLSHDTKQDLIKWQGGSKSQENIAAMLGLTAPKVLMTQADWREANRLTPKGLSLTKKRVLGDVRQHIEMRSKLIDLGLLRPPRVWTSEGGSTEKYTP